MDTLNIQKNLFLEQEELVKFQDFIKESKANNLLKSTSAFYGIVPQSDLSGNDFLVEVGTNAGTIKIDNPSFAIDSNFNFIKSIAVDNIDIPAQDAYYWLKVSYREVQFETGTVSIATNGQLTGSGTLFNSVLRGQSTKKPVKIKFYNEDDQGNSIAVSNTDVYEVVSVTNDTTAIISGTVVAESNIKYIVVGAYTNGEILSTEQKAGLYNYDFFQLTWVAETVVDTAPTTGYTSGEDFYLARVYWNSIGGAVTVTDKREDFWSLSNKGTKLQEITGDFNSFSVLTSTAILRFTNATMITTPIDVALPASSLLNEGKEIVIDIATIRNDDSSPYTINFKDGTTTIFSVVNDSGISYAGDAIYKLINDGTTYNYYITYSY